LPLQKFALQEVHLLPLYALTRMSADDQRDGRPAECRWRHLLNAAKFG